MAIKHVIIGSSGGIGAALLTAFEASYGADQVVGLSRAAGDIDLEDEASIEAATAAFANQSLTSVVVAAGILRAGGQTPEKSWRHLDARHMARTFAINTIGPALVAKYFMPKLVRKGPSVFAALSARIGSISDNRIGGWYSYRASKAALNQIIKSLSIEAARTAPERAIIGLHPGTVDTLLSKPHTSTVAPEKLFTPDYSASQLFQVITSARAESTGRCFAYDGSEITP